MTEGERLQFDIESRRGPFRSDLAQRTDLCGAFRVPAARLSRQRQHDRGALQPQRRRGPRAHPDEIDRVVEFLNVLTAGCKP